MKRFLKKFILKNDKFDDDDIKYKKIQHYILNINTPYIIIYSFINYI